MASQTGQRIRYVKCAKCFKILQEPEDVPVYQCGGCSTILQAKRRSITPNATPTAGGETERAQASEPETNNVSITSGQDKVLPSSPGHSSGQEDKKQTPDMSIESTEKQLGDLQISNREEGNVVQLQERSKRSRTVAEATEPGASSGSLNADQVVAARASNSSSDTYHKLEPEISFEDDSDKNEGEDNSGILNSDIKTVANTTRPGTSSGSLKADHVVATRVSNSSTEAGNSSPAKEEQTEDEYIFHPHRPSTDDLLANKTSSATAYDGSESSYGEREDRLLDEDETWNTLHKFRAGKFKEQAASSSSSTPFRRRNGNTTYSEWHQNMSLQLEGQGGLLGRQGRRYVSEQLRPDMPFYPRERYTHTSPSYQSHNEFYSRAQSLQIPLYAGGMSYERVRGRGHAGWYSGYTSYTTSPQRPMAQPDYYRHEIVSDVEDYQLNRHHHHELQNRQRVAAKSHIRPTAGGAPFVSCYSCTESLQLPIDFLIFKRKHHLLRCGTCTTVLRFSLQSGTHLVPEATHETNANRSSDSTLESPSKPERPSSSTEIEEVTVARGSPLHRLMGYSTVSQVFKASERPYSP